MLLVIGLALVLQMMGIPCEGPAFVYGDNKSVLANTTLPHSTLKKKNNSIAYHYVREGCAKDEWRTEYINTDSNRSDTCTKSLAVGEKRNKFVGKLLHHVV